MNQSIERQRIALVVDDDQNVSRFVAIVLETLGSYGLILTAKNPEEALGIIEGRRQAELPIDEVWTDIRMPNPRDGIELARKINESTVRSNNSKMKIVLMSGTMEDVTEEDWDLFEREGWETLRKPFDLSDVTSLVEKFKVRFADTGQ